MTIIGKFNYSLNMDIIINTIKNHSISKIYKKK